MSITKVIFLKGTGMINEPYNAFGELAESVSKVGELIEKSGGFNRRPVPLEMDRATRLNATHKDF